MCNTFIFYIKIYVLYNSNTNLLITYNIISLIISIFIYIYSQLPISRTRKGQKKCPTYREVQLIRSPTYRELTVYIYHHHQVEHTRQKNNYIYMFNFNNSGICSDISIALYGKVYIR